MLLRRDHSPTVPCDRHVVDWRENVLVSGSSVFSGVQLGRALGKPSRRLASRSGIGNVGGRSRDEYQVPAQLASPRCFPVPRGCVCDATSWGTGRWGVEPCVLLPNTPHCAALTQPHDGSGYRASFPHEAVPTFFAQSAMACPLLWGDALSVSHVYGSTVTLLGWCCLSACCLPPVLLVESPTPPARLPG